MTDSDRVEKSVTLFNCLNDLNRVLDALEKAECSLATAKLSQAIDQVEADIAGLVRR
jgi:hypothetical protein